MKRDLSERMYLARAWEDGVCPRCGKKVTAKDRVGSGRRADGGFCSLQCYAEYYQAEIRSKYRRIMK
jgi:hypothetical protein